MTNAEYRAELSQGLNKVYSDIEANRNVVIPTTVRQFIEETFIESLVFRRDEWLSRQNIDLDNPTQLRQTIGQVTDTVSGILMHTSTQTHGGVNYISLIGTLEEICNNWCGIFPFCR